MRIHVRFIVGVVMLVLVCLEVQAQEHVVEAESGEVSRDASVKIIEDTTASGGKATLLSSQTNATEKLVSLEFPAAAVPGRYRVRLHVRAEHLHDLGKALRIEVRQGTNLLNYAAGYGLYLKGKSGYQDFVIDCDWREAAPRPVVSMRWTGSGGSPSLYLDTITFVRSGNLPDLTVTKLYPDRIRYLVNQDGDVSVTVRNFSQREQTSTVKVELTHDLEDSRLLGSQDVTLPPQQETELKFPLKRLTDLYGHAVVVTLWQKDNLVDRSVEYFTVHNNPFAVTTGLGAGARDKEPPGNTYNNHWGLAFVGIGTTDAEILKGAAGPWVEHDYTVDMEFGRLPGETIYMAPKEPVWIDSLAMQLKVKHEMQVAVAGMKQHGVGCHVYLLNLASGLPMVSIMRQHPEWFVYSAVTGDIEQWYDTAVALQQQAYWDKLDWEKLNPPADGNVEAMTRYVNYVREQAAAITQIGPIGTFIPNFKRREVLDYVADQVIASTRMFGWDGLRWDCGNLETGPLWGAYHPWMDFWGKPLAATPEEMVEQTVANLKYLKARVRKEFPNFAFGSNYGEYTWRHYPKVTEELCRDGGLILIEETEWYDSPTSPYHTWEKYYEIMSDIGENITSLGGHASPMTGLWKSPTDLMYGTIFGLAGKGHPHVLYYNSRTPAGNFAQFCTRFGRYIYDPSLRRLSDVHDHVSVRSSSPIWWDKTVQRLVQKKSETLVVHLINPPVAKDIGIDPTCALPEPVSDILVSAKLPRGKKKARAWALTGESWKVGDSPKTQAVALEVKTADNHAAVTLPQVLYWKMIVFQFE